MGLSFALVSFATLSGLLVPQEEPKVLDVPTAVSKAVTFLVERQEGPNQAEWPYEGVYRVPPYEKDYEGRRQIPFGYRVGGTSITACALMQAPGYAEDELRQAAVARATQFVIDATDHELMGPKYDGGYDVRGWGYIYAIDFLMRMEARGWTPKELKREAKKAAKDYLASLADIEIPEYGGWNYARKGALSKASPTSPFMTAPAVHALLAAKAQGYTISKPMLKRALDALEHGRLETGEVPYSYRNDELKDPDQLPGSIGRMLATEVALQLGGRSSTDHVRRALNSFFEHWEWLDKRRAQTGTHVAPYGVAPYYFYYAHYQAALAIELLPEAERENFRKQLRERFLEVQLEDGMWNDRVFPRTANYGTAITVLSLTVPGSESPGAASK